MIELATLMWRRCTAPGALHGGFHAAFARAVGQVAGNRAAQEETLSLETLGEDLHNMGEEGPPREPRAPRVRVRVRKGPKQG